jgi:hypothetical protein
LTEEGAQAYTQDGSMYEGDIVVGADGIHSAVRDEMWRLGKEQSPGYFSEDENSRTYCCICCLFIADMLLSRGPGLDQVYIWNLEQALLLRQPKSTDGVGARSRLSGHSGSKRSCLLVPIRRSP